tara:strand:+ start:14218 stop:14607 length:390 start_codon:yes stop_codon:yes gene_type:complete
MEMNKNTLTNFRNDFKVMATMLEEQYGLSVSLGAIRYSRDSTNFTCKLTATNVGDLAPNDNVEQAKFNVNAKRFGFQESDFNRETSIYGKPHTLVGFNSNARKNVCVIRQISSGTNYVIDKRTVTDGFK